MDTTDKAYDGLKRHYGFDQWPRAAAAKLGAVRSFLPKLAALHALSFEDRVPMASAPGAYSERYVGVSDPGVRVRVDVATYTSIAAAHDALLRVLAKVSAPKLPSGTERGVAVGDVAFAGHGEPLTAVFFVRRNVFVDIRSIGSKPVDVTEIARMVDTQILGLARAE